MEMTIVEEKENEFFNRKELKIRLKHAGMKTPSKSEVAKELASKYTVDENQVVVDYIFSIKGIGESFAKVKILRERSQVKDEAQASETA